MTDWVLVSDDPINGVRVWEFDLDDTQTIVRTEYYAAEPFMDMNAEQMKSSDGARWGDGRVVASVPLHIWAREIAPRLRDGNDGSIKRWLNDTDNQAFRTFRGSI